MHNHLIRNICWLYSDKEESIQFISDFIMMPEEIVEAIIEREAMKAPKDRQTWNNLPAEERYDAIPKFVYFEKMYNKAKESK